MTKVSITTLLDAGAHFGHQTRRWNPKMKPYIFGSRGDIYIIDLKQTLYGLDAAYTFVSNLTRKGGTVLFVGTKKQAQEAVADAANTLRHALRERPLARRHAHQLRHHPHPREAHGGAGGHGRRRPHGAASEEGADPAAQGAREAADQPQRHPQHEEACPTPSS